MILPASPPIRLPIAFSGLVAILLRGSGVNAVFFSGFGFNGLRAKDLSRSEKVDPGKAGESTHCLLTPYFWLVGKNASGIVLGLSGNCGRTANEPSQFLLKLGSCSDTTSGCGSYTRWRSAVVSGAVVFAASMLGSPKSAGIPPIALERPAAELLIDLSAIDCADAPLPMTAPLDVEIPATAARAGSLAACTVVDTCQIVGWCPLCGIAALCVLHLKAITLGAIELAGLVEVAGTV